MTHYDSARALELLRLGTGVPGAQFRADQEEAIRHVVEGRGRLLVVQRTGWGKSFVYFIAARMLREQGLGPAILISPLLALMRNQIAAAERMGVRAHTIHSGNRDAWQEVFAAVSRNEVDVLLVSPERLGNEEFRAEVLAGIAGSVSLLIVDEAHCISDWGHDFRPHYRLIERMIRNLPPKLRLIATTATANNRVLHDLQVVLGPQLAISRGELNRPSLLLQTIRIPSQAARMGWLATHLPTIQGSGIVYTLTVRDAEQVAAWLQSEGISVKAYTGQTGDQREALENALLANKVKALVATTALGMGFDKPDLAFVIHYQTPGSVVAYYQQVGRAGRALPGAYGVLLSGEEENEINDYFIQNAFPTRDEVTAILSLLREAPNGLTLSQMLASLNNRKGRIEQALQVLALESPAPVIKDGSRWCAAAAHVPESFWQRAERLTSLRREEQAQMQDYVHLQAGHMEFLIRALDGVCSREPGPVIAPLPRTYDSELELRAIEFLRRTNLTFEPRRRWPTGGMPKMGVSGLIPFEFQAERGRVLCTWGDAGWGELVRCGKFRDGRFSDELLAACLQMFREWNPAPRPEWVTCIPSLRSPFLVKDFAERISAALRIPFVPALFRADNRGPQKAMANGVQQALNVDGAFLVAQTLPPGPVLLFDDMVDSKWTMTVAAHLLRSNGSGPVFPIALASTANTKE